MAGQKTDYNVYIEQGNALAGISPKNLHNTKRDKILIKIGVADGDHIAALYLCLAFCHKRSHGKTHGNAVIQMGVHLRSVQGLSATDNRYL